ncbi:small nucleolar RNA-interacting 2 [Octopus vulgaris]|uniref:Small nucleolar RNA-interacting 2 n=2 Tax=Octopus TaxID=6643 RepID=A0AA36BMX8_OCTVU|nr:U3 small nucleolar RNA-interacting protein 2 [Octopus sinensis]CAI9737310.1 small nucleolar RNA-interacting 2 [Octopus vulgaris]
MSFFIRNDKPLKKRKLQDTKRRKDRKDLKLTQEPTESSNNKQEEEIESDSDVEYDKLPSDEGGSSDEETAQEKKIRLAKKYLAELKSEGVGDDEDGSDDDKRDAISDRLKHDFLEQSGKLNKQVADEYLPPESSDITYLKGHKLPITCIVITPDNNYVFSASKDCSIIKWSVAKCSKVHKIPRVEKGAEGVKVGHTTHILALAISSDGEFLVSGDKSKLIHIWNPTNCQHIQTFKGHRDAITGLAFRKNTHQMFSCSQDRSVKVWDLDQMSYVETLFGHQDTITGIDSLTRERALTSGGRDGSVRIWKILEESQLVFNGHKGSIDCISLINDSCFISGGDDNCLCLWNVAKKKPVAVCVKAHSGAKDGVNTVAGENWISSVAAMQHTDLVASGSKDGFLRFWKCGQGFKNLKSLFAVQIPGFINSIQFSKDGSFVAAGVGQEHKSGRWWRIKEAKNAVCVIKLRTS